MQNLLKPKSYYMDTLNNNGMNFSSKKQFGLVAQDLSSGTYTYSLVAEEKVVATKRMVKAGFLIIEL